MTTGELIRQARKKAGLTQKQLGERCGMADSAIRKYESGRITPKTETIKKIAAALNVPWYKLYSDQRSVRTIGEIIDTSNRESAIIYSEDGKVLFRPKADVKNVLTIKATSGEHGFTLVESDANKIEYLYSTLNESGKAEAVRCLSRYIDKESLTEVMEYLQQIASTPQYQKKDEE